MRFLVFLSLVFSFFVLAQTSSSLSSLRQGKISKTPFYLSSLDEINSKNFPDIVKSFDYPNAQITDVVKAMSVLTGVNFIVDSSVKGTISIIAPSPITVAEAFQAFLSALSINGFTIVRSGSFWKVVSSEKASRDNIDIYTGQRFPGSDHFITKIFKLKNTNVKELEVHIKQFLTEKQHKIIFYEKANTIIISDYGSTIEKLSKIIGVLDVPDMNRLIEVIPIKYAPAFDIATKLQILIDDDDTQTPSSRRPRSRSPRTPSVENLMSISSTTSGISAIIPDERTNSIVVSGSQKGIQRVKNLIKKLDFYINPQIAGGIYVYYVKHGKAEDINQTLNNILYPSNTSQPNNPNNRNVRNFIPPRSLFSTPGYDLSNVVVSHDKSTNSLIITASRHEYETLKGILDKIDIPKNQVFIKTIIMDMNAEDNLNWDISAFKFLETNPDSTGLIIPRIGFSSRNIGNLLTTGGLSSNGIGEGTLSFGGGSTTTLSLPATLLGSLFGGSGVSTPTSGEAGSASDTSVTIPSLMSLINIIKRQTGANILSTPQLIAIDNEESSISVGINAPVSQSTTYQGVQGNIPVQSVERQDINTTLKITPYINPDGHSVRLIIEQRIDSIAPTQSGAAFGNAETITKREIKTNVILNDEETAVIGGLITDNKTEEVQKIPILGDIPIVGWLFKGTEVEKKKNNLVVFITPKIIRTSQDYQNILQDKIDERMDFIKKHIGNIKQDSQDFLNKTLSASQNSKKWAQKQPPLNQKKNLKEEVETPFFEEDETRPTIIYNEEN